MGNTVYRPLLGLCFFGTLKECSKVCLYLDWFVCEKRNGPYTKTLGAIVQSNPKIEYKSETFNMSKIKIVIIFFTLLKCVITYSQNEIGTTDKSEENIYKWITSISKGDLFIPEDESEKEFPLGESYRLIITTSEIYNGIYIEKIIEGENGGIIKIAWKRIINENDLYNKFPLRGEFAGVEFINWNNWNSFNIKIQGELYKFSEIEKMKIKVEKMKN